MTWRTGGAVLAVAAGALLLAGCGSDGSDSGASSSAVQTTSAPADPGAGSSTTAAGSDTTASAELGAIRAETVLEADQPIVLIPRPGDDHLWLGERAGTVRRVSVGADGRLRADEQPALDISEDTTTDGERGLLGLAFSPDGDTLFVSHTNADGNTRLLSFAVDGDRVDLRSRKVLLAVDQPFANHNGGDVAWGPDDRLWFGFGDGGAGDDPANRAQDPDQVLGKIVRLDPTGGDPEIVVSGVRNPWRFAFDTDGSLWIADVGQNAVEEVDHLPADRIDGANLGWSGYEGSRPYLDGDGRRPADAIPPVFEYTHDDGNCSIIGGFPYRGTKLEGLQGAYLFVDYCAGAVRAVRLDDRGRFAEELDLGVEVASPTSFGVDADGEPFVLSSGGAVVRLVPAS